MKKTTVYDCSVIELPKIHNRAGNITPINEGINIPFEINQVFPSRKCPKDKGEINTTLKADNRHETQNTKKVTSNQNSHTSNQQPTAKDQQPTSLHHKKSAFQQNYKHTPQRCVIFAGHLKRNKFQCH